MPPFFSLGKLPVLSSIFSDSALAMDDLNLRKEVDVVLKRTSEEQGQKGKDAITTEWFFSMPAYKALSVSFKQAVLGKPDEKLVNGLKYDPKVRLHKETNTDADGEYHGPQKDYHQNGLVSREDSYEHGTLVKTKSFDERGIEQRPGI